MMFSETQAHQLLACYRDPESVADTLAEDHFTADELRLANIFKFTFHTAALAKAHGRSLDGKNLVHTIARIYNVSRDDVRNALAIFTEHVTLHEWIAAASSKHDMTQVASPLVATDGVSSVG